MTKSQQKEITILKYFANPIWAKPITDDDIKKYFEWSEQGLHKDQTSSALSTVKDGFDTLVACKRWRHRHIEMYEESILSCDMPYISILDGMPLEVVEYLAKEMFKGLDKDLIMWIYYEESN